MSDQETDRSAEGATAPETGRLRGMFRRLIHIPTPVIFLVSLGLALALVWKQGRSAEIIADLRRIDPAFIVGVLALYAVGPMLQCVRWDALARYLDDGRIELDNSAAERALRAVAVGRKNYLFAGSDSGGERAAVFYSLIGSAKLNGLDPEAYLNHVFSRIAEHPITRIEELLPWNVAAHLSAAKPVAA